MVNWLRWKRRWNWWCVEYRPTPFWFLYAALAVAPWAGAERSGTLFHTAQMLLGLTCLTWIARCLAHRHLPRLPAWFYLPALFLTLQAIVMGLNGVAPDPSSATSTSPSPPLTWLPSSRNRMATWATVPDLLLLLTTTACVIDISRHSARRHELWRILVITGVFWAAWGLTDKIQQPAWTPNGSGRAPFASFSYHANAASYLNLIWPLALGLFCTRLRQGASPPAVLGFGLLVAIPFAAEMVNTSRAGTFLAALLAGACAFLIVRRIGQGSFATLKFPHALAAASGLVLTAGALIWVGGASRMVYRWQKLPGELVPDHHRWLATQGWFQGSLEAGFFGFGPNSFTTMARQFVGDAGMGWIAEWPYAHMDPLQTVMEWGWLGATAWTCITLGSWIWSMGPWTPSKASSLRPTRLRHTDSWMRNTACVALAGVFLHSLVDYPLQIMPVQLVSLCLVGTLWSRHRWPETSAESRPPSTGLDDIPPANIISFRDKTSASDSRTEPASNPGRDPEINTPSASAPAPAQDHSVTKNRQSAIP